MKEKPPPVFDINALDYDSWFDRHPQLFQKELGALLKAIPGSGIGIEIGVGTGRFAEALKIPIGIESYFAMAQMAIEREIIVIRSKAEDMPLHNLCFDYVVMITTDCFLTNISNAFAEVHRILKKNGSFIAGMIDKESVLGRKYETTKAINPWYKNTHFHSVPELTALMQQADFTGFEYWQTLAGQHEEIEEPLPGFGKGSYVVISAQKM
jgi:ubiquinone/menaquinone biosynthesis C-methylase UbiE